MKKSVSHSCQLRAWLVELLALCEYQKQKFGSQGSGGGELLFRAGAGEGAAAAHAASS